MAASMSTLPLPPGWLATIALMAGVVCAQPIPAVACADARKPAAKDAAPAESSPADKLALEQQRIAEKYKHLEDVLLRMAELSAATDPRRAALLKKAVAQSKEQLIAVRFERLVELLGKDQLSRALENQTEVDQDLRSVLELLMSENRAKRIESGKGPHPRVPQTDQRPHQAGEGHPGPHRRRRRPQASGRRAGRTRRQDRRTGQGHPEERRGKAGKPSGTSRRKTKGKDDGKPAMTEGKKSDGKTERSRREGCKSREVDGKDSKEQGKRWQAEG